MESRPIAALTGGTGFIGSHLAEALLGAGYRVRALVRRPEAPGWLKDLPVEIVKGDVRDASCLGVLVAGASAVVHAAGKTSARSYGVDSEVQGVQVGALYDPSDRLSTFSNWYLMTRRALEQTSVPTTSP